MRVRNIDKAPRLVVWYGYAIFYFGIVCFPLALVLGIVTYLYDRDILSSILMVADICGLAVGLCAFGIGVANAVRPVLIVLLIIIMFACGLVGFLLMLGKNPEYGYYLWAIGGILSLSLILILAVYWKRLPN